jgi:hypothetical protein
MSWRTVIMFVVPAFIGALLSLVSAIYAKWTEKRASKERKLTVHMSDGRSVMISGHDAEDVENFLKKKEKAHTAPR